MIERGWRILALLALSLALVAGSLPAPAIAQEPVLAGERDLANVPLPVSAMPENGYQVLTGGFLDADLTAHWIASPRDGDLVATRAMLDDAKWTGTYVLDLALLEDRAYAHSDILALVQTNVYAFGDEDGALDAWAILADFSAADDAETVDPATPEAETVRLRSQSGDTYRSVVAHDNLLIEITSLETQGFADEAAHRQVVADTVARAESLDPEGLGNRLVFLADEDRVADLFNTQQTGVHQVYRLRDGEVQPAAGELRAPEPDDIAPGIDSLIQSSQGVSVGGGVAFLSSWVGEFASEDDAAAFIASLPQTSDGALLVDPFYTPWETEQATGGDGTWRVTGTTQSGPFSGIVEIRQEGPYVVGIGWRTFGNVLPDAAVPGAVADAQVACLAGEGPCGAIPVDTVVPDTATPAASPVADGGMIGSEAFGWSVPIDPAVWTVNEQFSESGYDFVELQAGQSLITFESVIDQAGDPEACILNEMRALQELESHAVIEVGSDVPDGAEAGLEDGHAWITYTVEPLADERADQEYTIRIDCYTLVEGGASLVMMHRAPRDAWAEERGKGDGLRDALVLPVGVAGGAMLEAQPTWRWIMIDRHWIGRAA